MKYSTIILLIPLLLSCNREHISPQEEGLLKNTCKVSNPLEELAWLKEEVNRLKALGNPTHYSNYILQGEYKKQTVFHIGNNDPAGISLAFWNNCKGEVVGKPEEFIQIFDDVKNKRVIWKSN